MRSEPTAASENERFGLFLKHVRKRVGLSQVEVAQKLEQPQSFVSKFERGERRLEVIEFLIIAEVLRSDPVELLREFVTWQAHDDGE